MSSQPPNPALAWLAEQAQLPDAEAAHRYDFYGNFPAEMAIPEVRRIHEHYEGIDVFSMFHRSRQQEAVEGKNFTYGDTPVPVLYQLLKGIDAGRQHRFLDLGCGFGKAVLTAALLTGHATGVDLVSGAVDFCRLSARTLQIENTTFLVQDILEADLSEADIVFVACTCFPEELRRQLKRRFKELRSGAWVVTTTHSFEGRSLRYLTGLKKKFSWSGWGDGSPCSIHIHRRH